MAVSVPTTALWLLSTFVAIILAFSIVLLFQNSLVKPLSIVILVLSTIVLLWLFQWNRTSTRNDIQDSMMK